jgi:cytochrome c556
MSSLSLRRFRLRGGFAVAAGGLVLFAACVLAAGDLALGQEHGVTPAQDVIFARKILMGSIDMQMDEIETMTAEGGILNLADGQEHSDIISVMLMSFPHMFPASTNQWKPDDPDRDPATDTYAAPELWSNFPDFYERARDASKIALDAARARSADDFKVLIAQLRVACNSCHGLYQKTD